MFELNEEQANLLRDMAVDNPYQIIARRPKNNTPEKIKHFEKLNLDVDGIIAAGFVQDVTSTVEKPANFHHAYRVIGITVLGKSLFDPESKVAQA